MLGCCAWQSPISGKRETKREMEIRYVRNQWRMDDVSHLKVPVTLWQKRKERTRSNASGHGGIRPWPSRRQIQRTFPFFFLVLSNSTCVLIYRVLRPSFSLSLSVVVVRLIFEKQQLPKEKVKLTVDAELRYENCITKTTSTTAKKKQRLGGQQQQSPSCAVIDEHDVQAA